MSKALVVYHSLTGNTKKVAEAIFEALTVEKAIKPLKEAAADELDEFTLLFIGFPVHSHSLPYAVEKFIKQIPRGKKAAFFSTHGSLSGSRLSRQALEHASVVSAEIKVLGTFSCRGSVSPSTLEILMKSPEHQLWTEMAASARTHPDESDLEDARTFARQILSFSYRD